MNATTVTGPALRAAVIGVGSFGRHHARIYGELASEGIELVGLVDIDAEGPRPLADRLGVPLVSRIEDLPGPIDLASVAVPTSVHRTIAEPLLRRGVHCLVEKPVAGNTREAKVLVDAAQAGGARLQVGLVERFNPVLQALDRLGEQPVYVEAHRESPPTLRVTDVGVVLDLMVHDLDIVSHVVGSEVVDVQATAVRVLGAHEDVANARLTYANGCVASVTASRVAERRARTLRVFTTRGFLDLDYDRREAYLIRPVVDGDSHGAWESRIRHLANRRPALGEIVTPRFEDVLERERIEVVDREPLRAEIESLVEAVRGGYAAPVGGEDALRALGQAERILDAVRADGFSSVQAP